MLYGNFKNTTFTQSTYNCNAGVGFFIALIMRNFYPSALNADWYWYLLGMVVFSIPGLIASYKQFKSGYSLEQVKLISRPFRGFYWSKKPHECGAWSINILFCEINYFFWFLPTITTHVANILWCINSFIAITTYPFNKFWEWLWIKFRITTFIACIITITHDIPTITTLPITFTYNHI